MGLPAMRGLLDRRLLVNFTVDPEVAQRLLPPPFRPKLAGDRAVAGICLIRLVDMRPPPLPAVAGLTSENAAHRLAVAWSEGEVEREGVFIPRRDTSSRLGVILGGRVFPGALHHARFDVDESDPHYRVGFRSDDGTAGVVVSGRRAAALPGTSVFASLEEASAFFESGSVGYSVTKDPRSFDGVRLKARGWHVEPFDVAEVRSSFFEDTSLFPPGSASFDDALLMRRLDHEWDALPALRAPLAAAA